MAIERQKTQYQIKLIVEDMTKLVQLSELLKGTGVSYRINSMEVNDLIYKDVEPDEEIRRILEKRIERDETFTNEDITAAIEQAKRARKPRPQYFLYSVLNTYYQALRSYFIIFLCSLFIMVLFAMLEFFILNGIFKKDPANSQDSYDAAYNASAETFRSYIDGCMAAVGKSSSKTIIECLKAA